MPHKSNYRTSEEVLWRSFGCSPRERRVHLPSTQTNVRIQDFGEGDPVLFIHGAPNSGSTWAPLIPHLDGFRCFLVDRPGTGLSDDRVLRPDELCDVADRFVAEVLDGLELPRAHVVASSLGGFLALRSAAATPDRVDRMVQMACPAFAPGMRTPDFLRAIQIRPLRWLISRLPPSRKANNDIMRQIGHGASLDAGRIPDSFFEWYADLHRYTNTMRNDFDMTAAGLNPKSFDPTTGLPPSVLGAVAAKTLFLWGEDDGFGGRDVAETTIARMPSATLKMLPDFGHLPWLDDPPAIAANTVAFLSGEL